jgi:hypothetical protein
VSAEGRGVQRHGADVHVRVVAKADHPSDERGEEEEKRKSGGKGEKSRGAGVGHDAIAR